MCGYFQVDGPCNRVNVGVVVLVDARLEGAGADGVLGAETELEGDGLLRGERVEVEDGLGGGEAELFEVAARWRTFLLKGLQVFAEKVEAGRDAEVDHDHVGGLGEVVFDGGGGGGDVVLGEVGAVVGDVDGERLAVRVLRPKGVK